ncbi:Rpp14/Pop5 family-domain-containing protein [Russula ochroleuca]|uniref:Ribonuclease P/MRP protein subunit POP5 n=1 Tax=Russula ochroleuca TaxID=152965 RepID=A0A9P5JXT0_9AGAM|nr:Rpp14/Pop5 family-domain-containing protein [Russula ochroleuca]
MVRFKNRWLLIEFIPATSTPGHNHTRATTTRSPPDAISGKDVFNALKQSILLHFGDVGWGEVGASLAVKYFSPMTNLCIVRVARGTATSTTWAALTLLDRVGGGSSGSAEGHRVVPHVIHVSGTLKHAQTAAIEWNRRAIARAKAGMDVSCAVPQRGNNVAYFETSMLEIEELQD